MLYRKFYEQAYHKYLGKENINDYILRVLIMKVQEMTGNMSEFFVREDEELKNQTLLEDYINRVINGEPYQYVINEAEFLGNKYYVDKSVLIPRPETEELVLEVIKEIKRRYNKSFTIADVGTGSGCIAISLKKEFENASIFASDISLEALNIAKKNAQKLEENIVFVSGDLLKPFIKEHIKLDVLVSNPPYIENKEEVDDNVLNYEPHLALFAPHGLDCYEKIFKDAKEAMNENSILAFEFNYDQKERLENLINEYFPHAQYEFHQDYNHKWRYVIICIN